MNKFTSDNSTLSGINPAALVLGGNNETGSHWRDGSYCAHMLSVAKSICTCPLNVDPVILLNREGTG